MNVVLDTNVIVSALWSPGRNGTEILNAVFSRNLVVCYDHRIIDEYEKVLKYPKLNFKEWEVQAVLDPIIKSGISVVPDPVTDVPFDRDEADRKFYEVAKYCNAKLITGNLKHYPKDPDIMLMADFIHMYP